MIKYTSTRDDKTEYTFSKALLKGLGADGGLLLPVITPAITLSQIKSLQNKSYQEIALFLMKKFKTDFPENVLRLLIESAYSSNFDDPEIAPLTHLNKNKFVLELWHGPTAAFKDMALQFMPLLFSQALKINKNEFDYLILVATSGDTGAAALEGYKNKDKIKIIALYPDGGVSTIQELTMSTFCASNASVIAVKGDFDQAQSVVKEIFSDGNFNMELKTKHKILLSAANSINWGRLLPQMIYYLSGYIRLIDKKVIKPGDQIDVAVPSGNLGNVFAAYFVLQMGLPIRKIICASNSNNVLTQFFRTGTIDITNRSIVDTPSPSMNILIPSNLERLLFMISKSTEKTAKWMTDLKNSKCFSVDKKTLKKMQDFIFTDWVDNKSTLSCIKKTLSETNYLIDPHTAVAVEIVDRYQKTQKKQIPIIICATAHWSKFPEDTFKAIFNSSEKDIFKILSNITSRFPGTSVPKNIQKLQKLKIQKPPILKPKKSIIESQITKFLTDN